MSRSRATAKAEECRTLADKGDLQAWPCRLPASRNRPQAGLSRGNGRQPRLAAMQANIRRRRDVSFRRSRSRRQGVAGMKGIMHGHDCEGAAWTADVRHYPGVAGEPGRGRRGRGTALAARPFAGAVGAGCFLLVPFCRILIKNDGGNSHELPPSR